MTVDFWRPDWNAPPNTAPRIHTPTSRLILHHSVTPRYRGVDAPRRLDRIARGRGFPHGHSYSCGCSVRGESHEGRGADRRGAHTLGYNDDSAIVLVGNFDRRPVPAAMIEETAQLIAYGYRKGWWPDRITHPHAALGSTTCPGRFGRKAISKINRRVAEILDSDDGGAVDPEEEEDMVKQGERGNHVHWWQWRINEYLHGNRESERGIAVDGIYGPETAEAVTKLQAKWGFAQTGDIDFSTGFRLMWQTVR